MTQGSVTLERGVPGNPADQGQTGISGAALRTPLHGHVITPAELDGDLIAHWKRFCKSDRLYSSPFYAPQFTLAVAQSRPDARVAVLERGGEVIGFLPFHLTGRKIGKPIGSHISDYHGPVLAPSAAINAEDLLNAARLTAYDYNHLPAVFGALAASSYGTASSPQMNLEQGFDAYVAHRDARWTKAQREVRRRYRKTEAEFGPIRFSWHDPSDAAFRKLVALKNRQYDRLGIAMRLDQGWTGEVVERLRLVQDPDFAGVVSTLHAGDRLIAAHFGLRSTSVLHWWFPAYDLSLAKFGPGINLVYQCAMAAAGHGISTIDFGRGDEDFKRHFADGQVALKEGSIALPGSLASHMRKGGNALVELASRLPLGRYRTHPRKAVNRLISGVGLPVRPLTR